MPQPGDFGVTRIGGWGGRLIRLGQWLNGSGYRDFEHAFVVMPPPPGPRRNGKTSPWMIGAQPGAARWEPNLYDPAHTAYSSRTLTTQQREAIVRVASGLVGTPYSWLDYVSIGLHRLHVRPKWLLRYLASSRHMICSQLVAYCYAQAGVPLFDEWTGDVTPGDLALLIGAK